MDQLFAVAAADVADTSDDWYTPPWLFEAAGLVFDTDVAAPIDPSKRTCPARAYLTPVEDGLTSPWQGLIWMNPPFSRSRPWVERFAEHDRGLAFMPVLRTTALGMMTQCADAIVLLNIRFMRSGVRSTVPFPMLLAARGPVAVSALARVAAVDPFAGGAYHVRPR
jgi:hypothetical protein